MCICFAIIALIFLVFGQDASIIINHRTQGDSYEYIGKNSTRIVRVLNDSLELPSKISSKGLNFQNVTAFQNTNDLLKTVIKANEDDNLKSAISKRRCGISDIVSFNMFPYLNKWRKKDVTWQFSHHSHQLNMNMIRRAITEAFNTWSEVIPLNFTEVTTAGDIKISFQSKDHGNCPPFDGPGQVLAHATEPNGNPSFVHFDDEEYWVYRNENKLRRYPFTDLLNVAIHEIGHTLGLDHSEADDAIMNAQYNYPFDRYGRYIGGTLREDDIRRIQQLYGSRHSGERATTTAPPHFTTWYWGPWFGGEIPDYN